MMPEVTARSPRGRLEVVTLRSPRGGHLEVGFRWRWSCVGVSLKLPCHPEVALGSGWRSGAVAILDRCAVPRCGAVRILCSQWAGVVMRWRFWIVTWSFAAALCQFLHAKCASRGCGVFATTMRAHSRHTLNAKLFGSHFWCPIQTCFCQWPTDGWENGGCKMLESCSV